LKKLPFLVILLKIYFLVEVVANQKFVASE